MKSRCRKTPLLSEGRAQRKNMIAAELLSKGIIEYGGIHEVTDDGIYKLSPLPDRLNRKKVACFLDEDEEILVCLPRE